MAAIITSLWKLAENLGLSIKKDTIEEQINAMNKALEQKQENNIANALWNYADASGGGDSVFTKISTLMMDSNDYICDLKVLRSEDGIFDAEDTEGSNHYRILGDPLKKITIDNPSDRIIFTPAEDFDGFYDKTTGNKRTYTGDTVVPGDGKMYMYKTSMGTDTVTKTSEDFVFEVE